MRKCPSCGFNNPDSRDRCLKCSTSLVAEAVPDGSHIADRAPASTPLSVYFNRAQYWVARKLASTIPSNIPHRYPWTAAWLSILPGGGQIYNQQKGKAALFVGIYTAMFTMFAVTFFKPVSDVWTLLLIFWIFYAMADGFIVATRINGDAWSLRHVFAVWFALMFMCGAILFIGQALGHGFFYLVTVRSDSFAPGLKRGDKMFVVSTLVYRHLPPPGTVIYYNPARYSQMSPGLAGDDLLVNEQTAFEVVSAREGDVLECNAEGIITVNGEPVLPALLPTHPNGMPPGFKMTVKKKNIGVLMSHPVADAGLLGGSILAGNAETPREGMRSGMRIENLDNACNAKLPAQWGIEEDGEIVGVVKFCYYPPPSRRWFKAGGGLWREKPADYPRKF